MIERDDACEICGGEILGRCRCPRGDIRCINGHEYHYCIIHHTLVMGCSDHSKLGCSCNDQLEETYV
jgi:hypothetical protein